MRKALLLIVVVALLAVPVYARDYSNQNITDNGYYFWHDLNRTGKIMYVQGVMVGLIVLYDQMKKYSNEAHVVERMQSMIPWGLKINDIVDFINKVYSDPEYQGLPIYLIIVSYNEILEKELKQNAY